MKKDKKQKMKMEKKNILNRVSCWSRIIIEVVFSLSMCVLWSLFIVIFVRKFPSEIIKFGFIGVLSILFAWIAGIVKIFSTRWLP